MNSPIYLLAWRCSLWGLLFVAPWIVVGCSEQRGEMAGPVVTEATREAVRKTGKILPPPSTPQEVTKASMGQRVPKDILPPPSVPEPEPVHP